LNKILVCFVFLITALTGLQLQAQGPVTITAKAVVLNDSSYAVKANVQIKEGWHVYGNNPDGLNAPELISKIETAKFQDKAVFSIKPSQEKDILFTKAFIFNKPFDIAQNLIIKGFQPDSLQLLMVLNVAKADSFLSLEIPFSVALANGKKVAGFQILLPAAATQAPANACGTEAATTNTNSSPWELLLLGFLGGLIALITPCVFPMIPVTVSFFTKRSKTRKQGIKNGLLYGVSIFLIYVLASVPFHILGNVQPEIFNSISTNPWLNIIFFIIFVFFSISFFGFFEITLPSGIANKADSKSGLGSIAGIFFMAITLAIVSFSCTGPILGTLLVGSLQGGAWALTYGMAGFGLALALPFTLFAIFPQWLQSLPKSGGWLDTVKKVLAFLELALAFKFLSNADLVEHWGLLKREVFIGIWAVISIALALYLIGKLLLPHDVKGEKISGGRKIGAVVAFAFGIILIIGMVPKNTYLLKFLSGFPPPTHYSLFEGKNNHQGLQATVVNDYEKAVQLSKKENKPILIDFTGWACVNCRKMEENVWTDPEVMSFIQNNFILVSLYVDDKALLPVEKRFSYTTAAGAKKEIISVGDLWATFQAENFNQSSQPLYVVMSPDQKLLSNPVGYTPDAKEYLNWLQCSASKAR
jgi:thiol:disulfide interchange protein DsbD